LEFMHTKKELHIQFIQMYLDLCFYGRCTINFPTRRDSSSVDWSKLGKRLRESFTSYLKSKNVYCPSLTFPNPEDCKAEMDYIIKTKEPGFNMFQHYILEPALPRNYSVIATLHINDI